MNKEWQLVNFCEFDKYATKSYCAVHNVDESLNLGDITKVDETQLNDFTMMCGGSPCQDFSVAGKQAGAEWTCADCGHKYNPLEAHWSTRDKCPICGSQNIEKTRSSLLVEYLRILRVKHPKFAMYENVKNIVGKQFKKTFDMFIAELNEYGYNTYWKVLNAKDYGIPQNRERVFTISIRNDINKEFKANNKNNEQKILVCGKLNSSQDGIVCNPNGISPTHVAGHGNCPKVVCPCITPDRLNKRQNGRRFKTNDEPMFTLTAQDRHGVLETNTLNFIGGIGEKDIVGDNKSLSRNYPQGNRVYDANNIACSQTANGGGIGGKTGLYLVGNLDGKYEQSNRVYSEEGIAPTIMSNSRKTCTGGYNSPKIMQIGMLDIKGNEQIRRVYSEEGISPTLNTMQGGNTQPKVMYKVRQATKQGYDIAEESDSINLEQPNSTTRRGIVDNKIANILTCSCNQAVVNEYRIRKLTPLECYRLMGFDDEDFYKASALNSNSQLYKQAGNSICVNVLEEIFKNLF